MDSMLEIVIVNIAGSAVTGVICVYGMFIGVKRDVQWLDRWMRDINDKLEKYIR